MSVFKKYNAIEQSLQLVNRSLINELDEEQDFNNSLLREILDDIVSEMIEIDPIFGLLYQRPFYGGSYYDDLKVGKANEYDIDLVLKFPEPTEVIADCSDGSKPAFTKLFVDGFDKMQYYYKQKHIGKLKKILDDKNYISAIEVRKWMKSLLIKAMNRVYPEKVENKNVICISDCEFYGYITEFGDRGPALTLKLANSWYKGSDLQMSIDIAPCFIFRNISNANQYWVKKLHRIDPGSRQRDYYAVPETPLFASRTTLHQYWRLSFQVYESQIMKDKGYLKPALRLMKKLRDVQGHHLVTSYFLKTIFLWQDEKRSINFKKNSLSYNFMFMLKKYMEYIENKKIPDFWDKNHNLLEGANKTSLQNLKKQLQYIITDIEDNLDDPNIILEYLDIYL